MKKQFKLINLFAMALLLTTLSCKKDDEGPASNPISIQDLDVTIDENPTNGQAIGTVQTDGDVSPSFSITSQTPTGALSINSSTGELTVADAALFDFETNPIITATISVVGAENTATVTIELNDLNEIGVQDLIAAIDENPTNGQSVGTVQVDGNGPFSFSIDSQTPVGALSIDASSGELTVADASLFDFETNSTVMATIAVVGAESTATVTINLNDLDEISAEDLTVALDENPTDGQVVGSIQVNGGGNLSFSITSQTPAAALNINTTTGELTVADPTLFDFEVNPVITANISVNNTVETSAAIATINLNDVDEITVQDLTSDIDENPTIGQVVGTIQASANGSLTYTITYQSTAGALSIDQNTGELSVADETLFDFETNPTMFTVVSVDNSVYSVNANATINLNDLNEIGEYKNGGVIFWLDPADNNSGLVCAVSNQFYSGIWGCEGSSVGTTDTVIGSGATNTAAIESVCTTPGTVVDLIANLNLNGYDDWFLPSTNELSEMYANIGIVNATITANGGQVTYQFHWSSSEINANAATLVNLTTGSIGGQGKEGFSYFARAVRAF